MRLPKLFQRPEKRAYTELTVQALVAAASGEVTQGLTAGREIAAGHWGRAFSSADIKPAGIVADALTPHLGFIGRSLVTRGEAIFALDFSNDGFTLLPATSATISGGPNPASWKYELSLAGPSTTQTRRALTSDAVLNLRYAHGPKSPWAGVSPIEASGTTQKLLDSLELRLAQEAGGSVGSVIPVPNVSSTAQLQTDLRAMAGQVTLVETTSAAYGAGAAAAPQSDYQVRRIGADPPATLPILRRQVEQSVLAACGVPVSVLGGADASASREGYRQFLFGTIQPIAKSVAVQVGGYFDTEISFDFASLMAGDLTGRARAVMSLVNAGVPLDKALEQSGLME